MEYLAPGEFRAPTYQGLDRTVRRAAYLFEDLICKRCVLRQGIIPLLHVSLGTTRFRIPSDHPVKREG